MFKKIEIWILYLTIFLSLLFIFIFGVLVRQEIEGITKFGSIDISFISEPSAYLARLPESVLKQILKKNPLLVNDPWDENRDFYQQDGFVGESVDEELYMLLSRYSGDLSEGIVELIDLRNFEVLHTWNPDIDKFNSLINQVGEFQYITRDSNNYRARLIHPHLTDDGGLLFLSGGPLRKVNSCSELIFQNTKDEFHHSIETDIDGNIWSPSYIYPTSISTNKVGGKLKRTFIDDGIVKLSSDGKILYEKSMTEIFIENDMEYLLFSVGDRSFDKDPIHLNDIQPVNFDTKFWKKGDIFLSLRHQSMILLFRPSSGKIIWKGAGKFFHQHDVDILDDHRISIFNNNSKDFVNGDEVDGNNNVIIYSFESNQYESYLSESLTMNDVRTITEGRNQILPNGSLFVEETNYARSLYFNPDGSLRWSHVNQANDKNIYSIGWSRLLYKKNDIIKVNNFLNSLGARND
jgi:hypothetical protein